MIKFEWVIGLFIGVLFLKPILEGIAWVFMALCTLWLALFMIVDDALDNL